MNENARLAFIAWLKANYPQVYAGAMQRAVAPQLSGFLDTLSGAFTKFTDAVPKLAETYVTAKAQLDAIKVNIARARVGLMPIDAQTGQVVNSGALTTPVDKAVATSGDGSVDWQAMAPWLIGGGVLLLLLMKRR